MYGEDRFGEDNDKNTNAENRHSRERSRRKHDDNRRETESDRRHHGHHSREHWSGQEYKSRRHSRRSRSENDLRRDCESQDRDKESGCRQARSSRYAEKEYEKRKRDRSHSSKSRYCDRSRSSLSLSDEDHSQDCKSSRAPKSSKPDRESRSGHKGKISSRKKEKRDKREQRLKNGRNYKSSRSMTSSERNRKLQSGRREVRSSRTKEREDREGSRRREESKSSSRSRHYNRSRSSSSFSEEDCRQYRKSARATTSPKLDRKSQSGRKREKSSIIKAKNRHQFLGEKCKKGDPCTKSVKGDSSTCSLSASRQTLHGSSSRAKETVASLIQGTSGNASVTVTDNARFNIHVGDATTTNPQPSQSYEQTVTKLRKIINRCMWNKVDKKIEVFHSENLNEPDSQVYPQIALSPNFYKGEHIFKTRPNSTSRRNEYVKEVMFQFTHSLRSKTESLSFESVMHEFSNRPLPVVGLFAQAGAGKTTYMRNWSKETMRLNGIAPEHNEYFSRGDDQFQLLLYYDLKDFKFQNATKSTTLQELLFGDILEEDDARHLFNWLLENQNKAVLFFDGLDQVMWEITKKHATGIGPRQEANTPTILCNLLSRNILPESCIIISSREFKASSLPCEARPQKVYTLTGFTSDDAKSLFNTLVSQNPGSLQRCYETPYDKFTKTSSFRHFLTIPMFLMFAALVYTSFKGFIPKGVTALLAKVLELLQSSDNTQEENIWEIILKLKGLAQEGMLNGVVVFTDTDLKRHELKVKDVRDLLLAVPVFKPLSQRLFEGDFTLFFCHQIIQEFLSACFIVELSVQNFSEFVEEHLHEDRWSVVRRFVCGLLFLVSVDKNLVQISYKDEKQKILRESVVNKLAIYNDDLELFASIYESDDDQLIHSIMKIGLKTTTLTRNAAHMISSLISRAEELQILSFGRLTDELLNVMAGNLKNVTVRVVTIDLCNCTCSAAAFNEFFQNIDSDMIIMEGFRIKAGSQPGDRFNMENIRNFSVRSFFNVHLPIIFSNSPKSVDVCLRDFNDTILSGIFDRKNETLVFNHEVSERCDIILLQALAFREASGWLQPESVSIDVKGTDVQYLNLEDLYKIEKWQSRLKIDEIVLNTIHAIDEDKASFQLFKHKITSLVRLFKVEIMNIVITPQNIHHCSLQLEHDLSVMGCELKIHVSGNVMNVADLQQLIHSVKENQIKYLQMGISRDITFQDLLLFIKSCNTIKQFVIFQYAPDVAFGVRFSDIDMQKLKDAAEVSRINLKFEELRDVDCKDPWSYV